MTTADPILQALGQALLHFIWQGALVGLLFALALALTSSASARARYAVAVGTLLALAVLPIATFVHLYGAAGSTAAASASGPAAALAQPVVVDGHSTVAVSGLFVGVVALWLAGVLVMSLRLALGWAYIARLKRSADFGAAQHLYGLAETLKQRLGVARRVRLAVSERVRSPVVVGCLRPLILFPAAVVNRLPVEQLEMVLAHELAHIRRHDALVNLFQVLVETLLFYHPVVSWVSRRIRIERENACDDLAVATTRNRLGYVEMLASLERLRQPHPALALALNDGQMLGRIRRLVEQSRPRRQRGIALPGIAIVGLIAGMAGLQLAPNGPEPGSRSVALEPTPVAASPLASASTNTRPSLPILPIEAPPSVTEEAVEPESTSRPAEPGRIENPAAREQTAAAEPADAGPEAPRSDGQAAAKARAPSPPAEPEAVEPEAVEPLESLDPDSRQEDRSPNAPQPVAELAMVPESSSQPEAEPDALVEVAPEPVRGGKLVHQVEPEFPGAARRRGTMGLVSLSLAVNENGQVERVEILDEQPSGWRFGQAAREAVSQWQFEPFRQGGQAIGHEIQLELEFDPADSCHNSTASRVARC